MILAATRRTDCGTSVDGSDHPLLAHRKAQRLRSLIESEVKKWAHQNSYPVSDVLARVPFVQESIFLHHTDLSTSKA
jgi:hypothetical protein